jgi:hypothetical protein
MKIPIDGGFILISWVCFMLTIVLQQNYKIGALFETARAALSVGCRFR